MRILLVHATVPDSHKYLKGAVQRALTFNEALEGKATSEILYLELHAAFFNPHPAHLLYIGVQDDKIVAHGFATIAEYFGTKIVNCDQLWRNIDPEARFEPGQIEKTLESIKTWGRSHGAKLMRTYAINDKVAEIAEGYGWKRTRQIMLEMAIPDEE